MAIGRAVFSVWLLRRPGFSGQRLDPSALRCELEMSTLMITWDGVTEKDSMR